MEKKIGDNNDKLPLSEEGSPGSSHLIVAYRDQIERVQEAKDFCYFQQKLEVIIREHGDRNERIMEWVEEIFWEAGWEKKEVSTGFKYTHPLYRTIIAGWRVDENGKPDFQNFSFILPKGQWAIVRKGGESPEYTGKLTSEKKPK